MSDISRKDTKNTLHNLLYDDLNCKDIIAIKEAISVVEKLEKIEQTLEDCEKGKFDNFSCFCRIKQIVKGE